MYRKIPSLNIDFIGRRKIAYTLSVVAILVSLVSLTFRGLNLAVDFTGGVVVEIGFAESIQIPAVSNRLEHAGISFSGIQYFGTDRDLVVRIPPQQKLDQTQIQQQFVAALQGISRTPPEIRRVEFVGAQVGQELVDKGGIAMLLSLGGIGLYIWMRFEARFALGALAATLHDPIITLGYFSLTWTEFDLNVLAAVLAIVGYSVNDTIVIFDRIRENFRKVRNAEPADLMNASINQTLSRSVITSGTTLMVAVVMLLFGGPQLYGFALALVIGILVGTYSSIYVASTAALDLGVSRKDLMPVTSEEPEVETIER
jgi:preprotein translocase subunit SecF